MQDYYWDADTETFVTTAPEGIVRSDYKTMDIVVMWRDLDADAGETFENHNSIDFSKLGGGIRLVESVPSAPSVLGALVASSRDLLGGPEVTYFPGENPDIIQLTLDEDGGKFKEATTPAPAVIRDDKIETWFDVVTYSQLPDTDAIFLRREEFVAITCTCELNTLPSPENYGLMPTLWNGIDYTEGRKAEKPIGDPSGPASQQSAFCGVCCRDHHDGAGGGPEDVYNLENVGSGADHPHYDRDGSGKIIPTPVVNGKEYVEACRLIRKDGFMRVTQDANQGAMIGFPEGYLESDVGAAAYSDYVVESAGAYYAGDLDELPQPNPPDDLSPHTFPARTSGTATPMPDAIPDIYTQQARSRAVYTDYLTAAAQDVIDSCFADPPEEDCPAPTASTPLEIYPFFELQMTFLTRWNNTSLTDVVTVTNDAIKTGNEHSRGFLELDESSEAKGLARIEISSHQDNLGLTASGPIDLTYDSRKTVDSLWVNVNSGDEPLPPVGFKVGGALRSSVVKKPASDLLLEADKGFCGQTDTEWFCIVTEGGTLTVSNYYLEPKKVGVERVTWACSELVFKSEDADLDHSYFELPTSGTFDIWVTDDFADCGR